MYLTLCNAPSRSSLRPVTSKFFACAATIRPTFAPTFLSRSATCRAETFSTTATRRPLLHFPKSLRRRLGLRPEAWADEFDRYLPQSLRKTHLDDPDYTNEDIYTEEGEPNYLLQKVVCFFLDESRHEKPVDFLTHLAVAEGRWDAVTWVVKTVTELRPPAQVQLEDLNPFSTIQWADEPISLQEATGQAIWAERVTDGTLAHSIESVLHWSPPEWVLSRNAAIGRVWQSIGNMIAIAVRSPPEEKDIIMSHVLELFAYLHHNGVIPESVYDHVPPKTPFSLCQPPVLSLLAPRIYTAVSDAAVHAQMRDSESDTRGPLSFLGLSRSSARPAVRTTYGLGPEIWLELILWSCLRGPWITDGIEILVNLDGSTLAKSKKWGAIYWSNLAGQQVDDPVDITWQEKARFERMRPEKAASDLVERTVTVEVVAAFIDALLNSINVGTKAGHIAWSIDAIVDKINKLKSLLERSNQGLIGATWNSIIFRLLEAGVADPNLDPQLVEKLLSFFAVTYPGTRKYNNAPQEGPQSLGAPSYIMEPSAAPLGIFHAVIWAYIKNGDQIKAVQAVEALVKHTDSNKKVVLRRFFHNLRKWSAGPRHTLQQVPAQFDSNLTRGPDPISNPQFPPAILAALLALARQSEDFKFGEWLLFSEDIDGPLIPEPLYDHPSIAAEVIQFGRATSNQRLIANALNRHSGSEMSIRVIEALLETQMHQGDWNSFEDVLTILSQEQDRDFLARVAARLAKYILSLQKEDGNKEVETRMNYLEAASVMFRRLVKGTLSGTSPLNDFDRFHGILSILATVGSEWQIFCNLLFSPSLLRSHYRKIENCIMEEDLREIVEGVARARGSWDAMRLITMWCSTEEPFEPWQVSTFARSPEPWHYWQQLRPPPPPRRRANTSVIDVSPRVQLRGRKPRASLPLLRIVYRQASREDQEQAARIRRGDRPVDDPYHVDRVQVWLWATRALRNTGMKASDIDYELGPRPAEALALMAQMAKADLAELEWKKKNHADFEISPAMRATTEDQMPQNQEQAVKSYDEHPGLDMLPVKTEMVDAETEQKDTNPDVPPSPEQQSQEREQ